MLSLKEAEMLAQQQAFTLDLERAKTAVVNGRMFNVMTLVLVLFIAARINPAAIWLAYGPILAIGTAYLSDSMGRRYQSYLSPLCIVFSLVPFLTVIYL